YGNTERGATHIRESDPVAEFYGVRIAAVFAADAEFDSGPLLGPLFDGHLHELTHAALVDGAEGIILDDLQLGIRRQERTGIVRANTKRHLPEVVRAEAEQLRGLGDFVGCQRSARDLDHRADEIVQLHFLLSHYFFRHAVNHVNL